jgi:hypothetical protein
MFTPQTYLPEGHVHPAVPVRSNTARASAALRSSSSRLPSSWTLAHRHAATVSCTSRRLLNPTTTGILLLAPAALLGPAVAATAAKRTDQAMATATTCSTCRPDPEDSDPRAHTASRTAARNDSGAGCHAGGPAGGGRSRPMPRGDAARTCPTRARVRRAWAKGGNVAFWSVRCA